MTSGTYRFTTSIALGGRSREITTVTATDHPTDIRWGFSLDVKDPHE